MFNIYLAEKQIFTAFIIYAPQSELSSWHCFMQCNTTTFVYFIAYGNARTLGLVCHGHKLGNNFKSGIRIHNLLLPAVSVFHTYTAYFTIISEHFIAFYAFILTTPLEGREMLLFLFCRRQSEAQRG